MYVLSGNVGAGTNTSDIAVALVDGQTHIELKYYRLSHTRALKESYRFNIWQAQTFLGKAPPAAIQDGWIDRGDGVIGLQITGKDGSTADAANTLPVSVSKCAPDFCNSCN